MCYTQFKSQPSESVPFVRCCGLSGIANSMRSLNCAGAGVRFFCCSHNYDDDDDDGERKRSAASHHHQRHHDDGLCCRCVGYTQTFRKRCVVSDCRRILLYQIIITASVVSLHCAAMRSIAFAVDGSIEHIRARSVLPLRVVTSFTCVVSKIFF